MKCPTCNHDVSKFGCTPGRNQSVVLGETLECACPPMLRLPSSQDFAEALADLVKLMERKTTAP